jgi:hypothetical protein
MEGVKLKWRKMSRKIITIISRETNLPSGSSRSGIHLKNTLTSHLIAITGIFILVQAKPFLCILIVIKTAQKL